MLLCVHKDQSVSLLWVQNLKTIWNPLYSCWWLIAGLSGVIQTSKRAKQKSILIWSSNWKLVSVFQDWWNSTSFANYYRTWNVVVHDWLYYYGYRDFLWVSRLSVLRITSDAPKVAYPKMKSFWVSDPAWCLTSDPNTLSDMLSLTLQLSNRRFRAAAMLSVFIVSAVVHEYALAMGFGFFYPVMFCLFAIFGGEKIYFNMQRLGLGNNKHRYAS